MIDEKNTVAYKSRMFAIRIIKLYKYLCDYKNEYTMSKQVLRSGTSIGANIAESRSAISRRDFLFKISIARKECDETRYWLQILHQSGFLTDAEYNSIYRDCYELWKMLTAINRTTSKKLSASSDPHETSTD